MAADPKATPESRSSYAARVAAPMTRGRSQRLTPTYALAWLHLLPEHAFPIRSREDLAVKLSNLLIASPEPAAATGRGLPPAARSSTDGENEGR